MLGAEQEARSDSRTRYDARPDLLLVRTTPRVLAPGPLHPARPVARRRRRAADRTAGPRAHGPGAALPAHAPRAGHGGDEPPGPGALLPLRPRVAAGLRRLVGPARRRPGGARAGPACGGGDDT